MRRLISATLIALLCGSIASAGFITSSGAGAFARNNDGNVVPGNDTQDIQSANQVGYTFDVLNPIIVNMLGIWDGPNAPVGHTGALPAGAVIGDGLEEASWVHVYDSTGAIVSGLSVQVGAGTVGAADEFAYAAVSPTLLSPGSYTIAAEYNPGGNAIYNAGAGLSSTNGGTAPLTTMSDIDITANRYGAQGSVPLNEDINSASAGYIEAYVGPSAVFTAVPEPSSFLFLSLIATSGFAWKRRQNLLLVAE